MRAPSSGLRYVRPSAAARTALDELGIRGLLEHVAEGARLECLAGERGVVLHREHHDGGLLHELGDRGQAGRARHVEVEHEHVGAVGRDHALRRVDLAGLGDHREAILGLEQQLEPGAYDRMVVREYEADRLHGERP